MQALPIITAEAASNPVRKAFWGGFKCTASHLEASEDCKICSEKEADLKGKEQRRHLFFLCACSLILGF